MNFKFTKFERKTKPVIDRGMIVYDTLVVLKNPKLRRGTTVDILLDNKNNAIKIVKGSTYKLSKVSKGRLAFSGSALNKAGLKKGRYENKGKGIFVLEEASKVKVSKKDKKVIDVLKTDERIVKGGVVNPDGSIDYHRLEKALGGEIITMH